MTTKNQPQAPAHVFSVDDDVLLKVGKIRFLGQIVSISDWKCDILLTGSLDGEEYLWFQDDDPEISYRYEIGEQLHLLKPNGRWVEPDSSTIVEILPW